MSTLTTSAPFPEALLSSCSLPPWVKWEKPRHLGPAFVFLEYGKSRYSLLLQPFLLLWERKKLWRIMETVTSWQGDCKVFCISSYFTLTFYSDRSYDSWLMAKVLIRTGQDIFISSLSIEISNLGQPKQSVKFFIVFLGFFCLFFFEAQSAAFQHFSSMECFNVTFQNEAPVKVKFRYLLIKKGKKKV